MSDFSSFFSFLIQFLFSSDYSIFNVPLIFYVFIPVVIGIVSFLIRRGARRGGQSGDV